MILKALYDYYERDKNSVPYGLQLQPISFVIVIDENGIFFDIEDCRQGNIGTNYLVPIGSHNNATSPLLFWDNAMYLLNYIPECDSNNPNKKQLGVIEKAKTKHLSFVERCKNVAEATGEKELLAVSLFYELRQLNKVYEHNLWNTIKCLKSVWLSFRVKGFIHLVAENKILLQYNTIEKSKNVQKGICLITGENSEIVRLCTNTPIAGTKNSAKLVSFNDSSFCSYNKEQGENSPISKEAEFAFSSSFKKLVSKGSHNKFLLGSRTFVFWASKDDEAGKQAEESLWDMLGFKDNDDPDKNIINVRKAFESIYSGSIKTTLDDRFYILGLAPNSARIAVTYWADIPLKDFSEMILRHFKDMEIVDTRKEKKPYFGLHSLLATVSLEGKSSNVSPNLPDAVVKSIFQGLPYPQTLFASCIRRIRAEQNISITRAAILKAYLNRLNDNNNNKLTVMLDTSNTNQGYLCGRLFAVLDKIQDDANNQRSIKERYINSASATPAAVFSTILNLSLHHSAKLNEGRSVYFEKIKQEIVDKISADGFPAHLDLQDQGRFFVGYYHQMQWFYTKNDDKEVDNND